MAARYEKAPFLDRPLNATQDVSVDGNIVHFDLMPDLTASDVNASTGAVTYSQDTLTEVDLTIDQWRHVAAKFVRKALRQSKNGGSNVWNQYKEGAKDALVDDIATKFLALTADVTTTDIDSAEASQPGEDELTAAIAALEGRNIKADTGLLTYVVTTDAYWSMKKQPFLRDADKMGMSPGGMTKIEIAAPYGVPIFRNTKVRTNGTYRENVLFHKEAFAYAFQEDMDIEEVTVADALAKAFAAHYLAGFKTIRENHAALIRGAS